MSERQRKRERQRESEKGANLDSSKKAEISFLQIDSLKVNTELFLFGQKVVFCRSEERTHLKGNPIYRKRTQMSLKTLHLTADESGSCGEAFTCS